MVEDNKDLGGVVAALGLESAVRCLNEWLNRLAT
jgi:hypothetical protein